MPDMTVASPVNTSAPVSTYTPAKTLEPAASKPAPKTDVIDLSKPPTPEQAKRLRSAGILGYGSVSASKTTTPGGIGSSIHFTVENQGTYFDLVNQTTVHHISSSSGLFTSNGSYALNSTTQFSAQSWDNSSRMEATLHTSAFKLNMIGNPSWVIPPHTDENGTVHLAQFGPSIQASVSGWHAVFSAVHSSGGQMSYTRFEGSALKTEITIPTGQQPDGAIDYSEWCRRTTPKELLDQIEERAQQIYRSLDIQA